jgi:predicted phosphodiesterase
MANTKKFIAFSCVHCPLEDGEAVEWMLGKIREHKPDVVVHLGDGREAASASKWPSEHTWTLEDEYQRHNTLLANIRKAAGDKAKLVMMEGNHDDNIRAIGRINSQLRSLCLPEMHEPELKNWRVFPYTYSQRGVYRLGSVSFAHGYEAGQNSDKAQSVLLGMPYGLFVSGHTHRPKHITQVMMTQAIPLPYWFANAGCLRTMDCDFMERKRQHQWGQAVVVGESRETKSPRMSKTWDAHTEIFRMYE